MHPIQDIYAHTDDVSKFRQYSVPVRTYYKYGLYIVYYQNIYFWEHITSLHVDSPEKRPKQLEKTETETKRILKKYYNRYSDILRGV